MVQKTKSKRDSRWLSLSRRKWPFVAMSVLIFILGNLIEGLFIRTRPTEYLSFNQIQIAVFVLRLVPTLLQVILVERFLKQSMRGWLVSATIGTLITALLLTRTSGYPSQIEMVMLVGFLTIYGPKAILQTLWLWRRFKQAWLWPIFMLVSAYIVPEALRVMSVSAPIFAANRMVFAVMEALLIFHLLSRPTDTEKAKIDHAADDQSSADHERLNRLQERHMNTPLWDAGDEQALQSEA